MKKEKNSVIFTIGILFLLAIGGYYLYNSLSNNKNSKDKTEVKTVKISEITKKTPNTSLGTSQAAILSEVYQILDLTLSEDVTKELYSIPKLEAKNMSPSLRNCMVIRALDKLGIHTESTRTIETEEESYLESYFLFSLEDIQNYHTKMFGPNITFEKQSPNCFTFELIDDEFVIGKAGGYLGGIKEVQNIIEVKKNGSEIEVIKEVYYAQESGSPTDQIRTIKFYDFKENKIFHEVEFDYENESNSTIGIKDATLLQGYIETKNIDVPTYKMIFEEKADIYQLISIERIN